MNIIYSLFKLDKNTREGVISATSLLGIISNVLIALVKIVLGIITSSIAIISEGANNVTDALSSVLAIVGAKLAKKKPDEKHPFGYGRIEYITSLTVAVIILVAGVEMLISSVKLIFSPADLQVSYLSLIIILVTAVIKFFLGTYTANVGKKISYNALVGVGLECRQDSFASIITIVSSLIFIIFGISVDAYAGILISALIIKAGIDVLKDTLSELIGRPGEEELASKIYRQIRETEGIYSAADMMLHNYGPDAYSGSVNVEIDHNKTVGEVYRTLHQLQLKIMHEDNVTMVFGIYAVDSDSEESKKLRQNIAAFVKGKEHVLSYHAVYIDPDTNMIYCDFIVDYKLKDWDALREEFLAYMKELYPENEIELTIETDFV